MGFLVRKTQPFLILCKSQRALCARVCLLEPRDGCKSTSRRCHHTKSIGFDLNLLPYAELFRLRRTTLRAAVPLYNLHSRN